jgi:hypothetical protein
VAFAAEQCGELTTVEFFQRLAENNFTKNIVDSTTEKCKKLVDFVKETYNGD